MIIPSGWSRKMFLVLHRAGMRGWAIGTAKLRYGTLGLAALGSVYGPPVMAQQPRYDVQELNFDLWCQQQAKLPPRRCDNRTPVDEKAYNAYRDKIDKYEIPYLQEKQEKDEMERNIMNSDPVDNPQGSLVPPPQ